MTSSASLLCLIKWGRIWNPLVPFSWVFKTQQQPENLRTCRIFSNLYLKTIVKTSQWKYSTSKRKLKEKWIHTTSYLNSKLFNFGNCNFGITSIPNNESHKWMRQSNSLSLETLLELQPSPVKSLLLFVHAAYQLHTFDSSSE